MQTANPPLFSVVLIGRNEEKTLPVRILASLKEFIKRDGDVVYLDTGSTDNSIAVAQSHGCRVFSGNFDVELNPLLVSQINERFCADTDRAVISISDRIFDFAEARNYAGTWAIFDHILVAGCDEYFTTLDIDAINELIRSGVNRMDIDYAHTHDAEGRKSICFRRGVFYNRKWGVWKGIVHEVVVSECPVYEPPPKVISCEHFQEENENRKTYLPGLALDCFLSWMSGGGEGAKQYDRNLHYLARELYYSGLYKSAIRTFRQHRDLAHAWDKEKAQSSIFIGDCCKCLAREGEAVSHWWLAYLEDGTRREPLLRLANYFLEKKDYPKAAAMASASLVLPNAGFYFNQTEYYQDFPHWILYVALWWMGDKESSKIHWGFARSLAPNNEKYKSDAVFYENL